MGRTPLRSLFREAIFHPYNQAHANKLPHENEYNEYLRHRGFACFSHPRGTSVCRLKSSPSYQRCKSWPSYLRLLRECTCQGPRPAAGRCWGVQSFFIGSVLPRRNFGQRQIHKTTFVFEHCERVGSLFLGQLSSARHDWVSESRCFSLRVARALFSTCMLPSCSHKEEQ
jgi:hypothetical protein